MTERSDSRASPAQRMDLKCRDCGSILGSIPASGLVDPIREGQACDTCRPFEELHAMVLTADEAFAKVEHRRPDFGGRVLAVHAQRAAHKAIANFLLGLERADQTPFGIPSIGPEENQHRTLPPPRQSTDEFRSGPKRPRSPTFAEDSSPSPKRRRSKRVSFDASVVVRDDSEIRDTDAFQRNSQSYFPGRNAPSQGTEFLDTSGWGLDFKDFHRLQWVGCKWIPRLEFDEGKSDDNKEEPVGDPHSRDTAEGGKDTTVTIGVNVSSASPGTINIISSEWPGPLATFEDGTKSNETDSKSSYYEVAGRKEESAVEVGGMNLMIGREVGPSASGNWSGEVSERTIGAAGRETRAGTVENDTN